MTHVFSLSEIRLFRVHLKVADMARSLAFYGDLLGFKESRKSDSTAALWASSKLPEHLVLTEIRSARPRPPGTTGLFHVAIRLPHRSALANLLRRLLDRGWPIQGAAHHGVSEAIYLSDPDKNGVELYSDVPRDLWAWEKGYVKMATEPLDVDNLLSEAPKNAPEWKGIDPLADIGHIHLQVSDLTRSEQFYHGLLGFDITQRSYPGALFLSAGGYHHHIGLNIWAGRGASPAPPEAVGLLSFALQVRDRESWISLKDRIASARMPRETTNTLNQSTDVLIRDPDGNLIEVVPAN
jgi:catechol 2,3-dioxygenase